MIKLILFLTPVLLYSCSGSKSSTDATEVPPGMMELDLSSYGMNFTMTVPDSSVGTLEVTAQSYGDIEIRVGSFFQIKIAPGGDMALRKSDMEGDLLFKTTIIKEEPAMIIYKSDLPDGSKSYHHFYLIASAGNNSYEIQDINDSGEAFSEAIINKMVEAVQTLKPKVIKAS